MKGFHSATKRRNWCCPTIFLGVLSLFLLANPANGQKPPNILLIMSGDGGIAKLSAYSHGLVGYKTANIDRIA